MQDTGGNALIILQWSVLSGPTPQFHRKAFHHIPTPGQIVGSCLGQNQSETITFPAKPVSTKPARVNEPRLWFSMDIFHLVAIFVSELWIEVFYMQNPNLISIDMSWTKSLIIGLIPQSIYCSCQHLPRRCSNISQIEVVFNCCSNF